MVWVVPAILWLALAADRPRWGRQIAVVAAVLFWSAPVWWVPYKNTSDLHLSPLQQIAGNSFFFATVLFVVGAAVLVVRRRAVQREGGTASLAPAGRQVMRKGIPSVCPAGCPGDCARSDRIALQATPRLVTQE
jgi:hypothetical protein